ncbi:hypothetical protein EDB81DRAFT_130708 [Dactylonectria macrodidyma]|uniref:NACHT domain-containing protein n=1 Tax=Dactylonectria macrodidyma TaxID=307937 RepID=A0A9P9IU19_9HYPO|nr:hypothetical protein EDB81DRAFT_130708 [Dactylonectria macrodidyma]
MRFELDGSEIGEVAKLAKRLEEEFKGAPTQWKKLTDSVGLLSRALQDAGVNFYGRDEQQRARFREAVGRSMKDLKDVEKILEDAAFVLKSFDGNRRQWCPGWGRPKYSRTQVQQVVVQVAATAMMIRELIAETSSATPESETPHDQQHQINHSRRMILDWLSPNDYASEHVDVVNRTHRDTARNIMISEKFTTWMTEEGRTIFCPGVSGAGKTIAAASVIEELKRRHQDNATVAVTYIYCNYHREESQTVQGLFESLLRQLVNGLPTLPSSVHSLYERYHQGQFRPRLDEVIHCVHEVATMYSRVFVVVDALDECSDNSGNECKRHSGDQTRLLSEMFQLQAQCLVNFFATSRPMANTLETFRQYPSLEIRAGEQDVRKYLDAHMSKLPPFVIQSPELQDQIKDRILQAMDGSFLLATLHLESLTNEQCPETLLQALTDLPTGPQAYTQVYEDLMRRIQTQSINRSNLAIDALHWLAHARRPLKVTELQHALAVELDSTELDHDRITPVKDIVSVCCGLVVVDEQSKVIRLVNRLRCLSLIASIPKRRVLSEPAVRKVPGQPPI